MTLQELAHKCYNNYYEQMIKSKAREACVERFSVEGGDKITQANDPEGMIIKREKQHAETGEPISEYQCMMRTEENIPFFVYVKSKSMKEIDENSVEKTYQEYTGFSMEIGESAKILKKEVVAENEVNGAASKYVKLFEEKIAKLEKESQENQTSEELGE
jgi:hypothetical protein